MPGYGHRAAFGKLTDGLNDGIYKIDNNSFKPYACCKHSHAALYAMQVLRTEHGLKPDDVEAIEILVNEITDFLINNPQPENPYGCKFSIQYCVAGMLKYGDMGVDRFLTEVIGDAEVRSLMAKTKVMRDAAIEAVHAADAAKLASKLIVRCKDGRVLELQVDFPKGDPPNPMSWDESVAKFMSLAAPVYGEEKQPSCAGLSIIWKQAQILQQTWLNVWHKTALRRNSLWLKRKRSKQRSAKFIRIIISCRSAVFTS